MEIWELLKRLQRQPSAEGIMSGNKAGVQNVDPTPVDVYNFLQGTGAGLAGMPVDLASTAMRPFGYNTPPEQTVGSSEWFGRQMGADPSSRSFTAGTFGSPDPTDALRMTAHLDDLLEAMTVFHGSPHMWDKLDLGKAGTGEGNAAYGHGFYTAERPGVAKGYKTAGDGKMPDDVLIALSEVDWLGFDTPGQAMANIRAHPDWVSRWDAGDMTEDSMAAIQRQLQRDPNGYLYELDLPDEKIAQMLDYDASLIDQPHILEKLYPGSGADMDRYREINRQFREEGDTGKSALGVWERIARNDEVNALIKKYPFMEYGTTGGALLDDLRLKVKGGRKGVSDYLNSLGIPGIRYFDGGSRGKGEGTRNFVIFDEQHITPLTRNGQPLRVPYKNAPDSLMGFSKPERGQKGFDDQNYAKEIVIRGTFSDGQTFVDAIRGLNTPHALERARRNWEGAKIEVLGEGKRGMSDLPEWLKLFEDNP